MPHMMLTVVLFSSSLMLAAEPDGDLKAIQGTWVITAANLAGRDHLHDFQGMKLTVTGNQYVINFAENSDQGTIKLDTSKTPRWIDLSTTEKGPFQGRNLPGIYAIKGDTIVLCLNSEKQDRPTKFEAPAKTPFMLLTFKRDKK